MPRGHRGLRSGLKGQIDAVYTLDGRLSKGASILKDEDAGTDWEDNEVDEHQNCKEPVCYGVRPQLSEH